MDIEDNDQVTNEKGNVEFPLYHLTTEDERQSSKQTENRFKILLLSLFLLAIGGGLYFSPLYPFLKSYSLLTNISQQIGSGLIISAWVSLLFEIALRKTFFQEINIELRSNLRRYFDNAGRINESGVLSVYNNYPCYRIEHGFSTARKEILIIQTWFSNIPGVKRAIETALDKHPDCEAKIYLLDPNCDLAKKRSNESNLPTPDTLKHYVEHVESEMILFAESNVKYKNRVKCFRYDSTPTISIFKHDDKIFWCPYFRLRRTFDSPWFELTKEKTALREVVEIYIEYIKTHSTPVYPVEQKLIKSSDSK